MQDSKTILITVGAIGLGKELTKAYAGQGHRVVICGRTETALQEMCGPHQNVVPICADLACPAGRRALVDAVYAGQRPLDLLIHNAAIQLPHDFQQQGGLLEQVETELAVNLLAPIELTLELLPLLKQSASPQVAFVTSALARVPKRSAPIYCATKAGLSIFTRALSYQLEGTGITVSEIVPDLLRTRMAAGRDLKALPVKEAARQIVKGLGKGETEIRLGRVAFLYTLHRLAPRFAYRLLKAS
ncbi:SDR family NAD(P)-dependent oxidoreductase [Roseibium denhamense]|uniref:SDR family NAD(P)-dependent oxidoreductase n=1 Tax=Roseibium denhamense TaxID=76305 RepID=UPI0018AD241A|nr:SDR family NAD(P)-dependent oxidoreductase [Roseibium denhamense]